MSGVFGVIDSSRKTDVSSLADRMARVISHCEWFTTDCLIDDNHNLALGRAGIGILNKEPQPVTSQGGSTVLFLAGEFFEWEGGPTVNHLKPCQASSAAAYALHLYELYGPEFVRHLAGAFIMALYDRSRDIVLLITDRFGLYPLYYCQKAGYLAFAPEVKGVLQALDESPQLDKVALAQYMRFQQVLGTRTFFEQVHLVPPASILTYDLASASYQVESYWSFDDVLPEMSQITFKEATQETARLMQQAVERRLSGEYRFGVYLSGGLDARTILAAFPENQPSPITLTYGLKDCRDIYYAGRIAKRAGTRHHTFEFLNGKWVADYVDLHLQLTEGFHSWVHLHGISTLAAARELFDINLTGFIGDAILGGAAIEPPFENLSNDLAYFTHAFWSFNQTYNWPGITEAEERVLYTPSISKDTTGLAFDSLRQELQPYLKYGGYRPIDYFCLRQSDLRHYAHYLTFSRAFLDIRHPYADYDLVDFIWRLPPLFKKKRKLEKAVLSHLKPGLAMIPYERDEIFPTDHKLIQGAQAFVQKGKQRFNRHVYPLFHERFTLHTDYESWLRQELREWAEAILFDPRTLNRGIFNPDFIHSIWQRHLSGFEQWTLGKIAPIISYEMMLRELYD